MAAVTVIEVSNANLCKAGIGHNSIVSAAVSPRCYSRGCVRGIHSTNFGSSHTVMGEIHHQLLAAFCCDIAKRIAPGQLTKAERSTQVVHKRTSLGVTYYGPYAVTGIRGRGSIFCRGIIGWGSRLLLWLGRLRLFRLRSLRFRYRRWFRSWAWCFCRL